MTTMTKRMAPFCGTIALLAQVFVFQGCGGSNSPSTAGTGGTPGTGGETATGGTPGTGGTITSTGGTPGTGGATTSTGGTPGTAGSSGTGVAACGNATSTGLAIAKGGACAATDTPVCTKTCGPEKSGTKTETCTATATASGTYAEGACSFSTTTNFMCYAIPTAATASAMCPATAPKASDPCTITDCIVCGGPSATSPAGTGYLDSTGAPKLGYCVCQASATTPTWSCSSNTAWPCPGGTGC
jgi:hypothetical protein